MIYATTKQRLLQYLDLKKISHVDFFQNTGLKRGFLDSNKLNSAVSDTALTRIIASYSDLNLHWLISGTGSMIKTHNAPVAVSTDKTDAIPLIPVEAIAGFGAGPTSITAENILNRYIIPDFVDVDFMISVKGSSMYPKYSSGDIIACRMIEQRNFFQWGRVFVIHHKYQGTMIKRLFPTDSDDLIECRSDNPKYPPFQVPVSEINNIALVIGVVRLE